jgi:hypothetical protein
MIEIIEVWLALGVIELFSSDNFTIDKVSYLTTIVLFAEKHDSFIFSSCD